MARYNKNRYKSYIGPSLRTQNDKGPQTVLTKNCP